MEEVATPQQLLVTAGYVREESDEVIPVDIVNICYKFWQDLVEIPLETDSNRMSLSDTEDNGPKWLLHQLEKDDYTNYHYWSPNISNFAENEEDWIIFKVKEYKSYGLKQIKIKNAEYSGLSGSVKTMRVEISKDKKGWIMCDPNPINVEKNTEMQEFELSVPFIKNIKYIKIVFIENHGGKTAHIKFVVNRIRLLGIW